MEIIKSILMGIVEGITEWLPISSTGHLILLEQLIKFNLSEDFVAMFRVVIQLGAILAVVVIYFKELWPFTTNKSSCFVKKNIMNLWLKIIIACVPAAIIGLLLDDWLDENFYNYNTVSIMLIVIGILFLIIDRNREYKINQMEQISNRDAFIIGIWQVLALIPGTSRSGATIIGGLLLGIDRPLIAQFTFYLGIPVMFGASGLKLIKYFMMGQVLTGEEIGALIVGMVTAFLVSIFAIKFIIGYVKTHDFKIFGKYRIVLGILVFIIGAILVY